MYICLYIIWSELRGGQRTSFMHPPLKKADKPARMLHVG